MTSAALSPSAGGILMAEGGEYPTIEDIVGRTPLVRLQRIPGDTSNVFWASLRATTPPAR